MQNSRQNELLFDHFILFRQLNVYRIRLHKNMFISLLLNSILVIVFKVFTILPQISTSAIKDSYIKQVNFNNSTIKIYCAPHGSTTLK